ncbi:hypothetical protein MTR_1g040275 [Medicago truncatula]|uniref:Uncharacterized protein n=1 Tax=Medicago truncatula TaxID=3880 RepID=A0A072VHS3_MEDTR|nr:hypothetical protein MTR_1g040275 [Medicago truncatula]
MKVVLHVEVEVPTIGVLPKSKLDRMLKQTSNKKVRPRKIQERDFVPKNILPFQPDSRGKWTPNYEGSCAMTFTTMNGDKLALPLNAGAVKKYSVKHKISVKHASTSASKTVTLRKRNMAKHYGKDLYFEQMLSQSKNTKKIKAR